MKDGIEREPLAVAAYEAQTGQLLEATGFLSHNVHMAGASLDGHLGDFEILISIKCRQPPAHWDFIRHGIIPAHAMAQMRHELWITGASEHHYVSWNPDFPDTKQLKFVVLKASELDIPQYEAEALKFLAEVNEELRAVEGWNVLKCEAVTA
jgi:YqaJ-like viral recombinase domain